MKCSYVWRHLYIHHSGILHLDDCRNHPATYVYKYNGMHKYQLFMDVALQYLRAEFQGARVEYFKARTPVQKVPHLNSCGQMNASRCNNNISRCNLNILRCNMNISKIYIFMCDGVPSCRFYICRGASSKGSAVTYKAPSRKHHTQINPNEEARRAIRSTSDQLSEPCQVAQYP